jgi:hypothetical protein
MTDQKKEVPNHLIGVIEHFLNIVLEYIKKTECQIDYEFGKGRSDFDEISKDGNLPEIYKMVLDYLTKK